MKKSTKMAAITATLAGGCVFLLAKLAEKRQKEKTDDEIINDGIIEMSMTAGDMGESPSEEQGATAQKEEEPVEKESVETMEEDAGKENAIEATEESEEEEISAEVAEEREVKEITAEAMEADAVKEEPAETELTVVAVLPSGPKTSRVRPTEEEETERLRQKLEKLIRF